MAVAATLCTAGHTVLISGSTLFVAFLGLMFFPTTLLSSVKTAALGPPPMKPSDSPMVIGEWSSGLCFLPFAQDPQGNIPLRARPCFKETVQDMFITPLYQQHASHTLASRAYGPQPHMRS